MCMEKVIMQLQSKTEESCTITLLDRITFFVFVNVYAYQVVIVYPAST